MYTKGLYNSKSRRYQQKRKRRMETEQGELPSQPCFVKGFTNNLMGAGQDYTRIILSSGLCTLLYIDAK